MAIFSIGERLAIGSIGFQQVLMLKPLLLKR